MLTPKPQLETIAFQQLGSAGLSMGSNPGHAGSSAGSFLLNISGIAAFAGGSFKLIEVVSSMNP